MIDQIWYKYDRDGNGDLDKEEIRLFVIDNIGNVGDGDGISEDDFDEIFASFDLDGSGSIEKDEMLHFVKSLLQGKSGSGEKNLSS